MTPEEIIDKNCKHLGYGDFSVDENQLVIDIIEYGKQQWNEAIKLAAEEALLNIDGILEKSNGQQYLIDEGNHYCETLIWIDKNSILKLLK